MKRSLFYVKIAIDIAMLLLFVMLMGYHVFGEVAHEWLGASLFLLFLAHNALNWRWYKALFKGKYTASRVFKLVVNVALWVFMSGNIASALMISAHVFAFLNIPSGMSGRLIHLCCTMWSFLTMSAHLGLHVPMFIGIVKKNNPFAKVDGVLVWIARALLLALCAYGIVVFVRRQMWQEMFLTTHFKYLPYGESAVKFLFDYSCVVCLFAAVGYYLNKLLTKISQRKRTDAENTSENFEKN